MDAAHLPSWLARLEEEMLGHGSNSKEPVWGQLEPNAKRRRVARFGSLSDAAIFQQRMQEAQRATAAAEEEEAAAEAQPCTARALAAAPPDAACVRCVVEERLDEKAPGPGKAMVAVLCPGCGNPFHCACLGVGGKLCMFCQGEEEDD